MPPSIWTASSLRGPLLLASLRPDFNGTFVSAFTVLCGARTDLPDRHVCCVFWLNIAAALIQILTAIVMVGWIMSIFWGMDMVILAKYVPLVLSTNTHMTWISGHAHILNKKS
ncbi:protein stum homolog isoform X4 [Bos indicus x Bos taurus]|uniref:protein stum homolog isoform X4 n=1 Tax=Bos indicus x Bos taurus TaxID=30522 RepID=UPI000F7D3211|nr:protein stum homolog isoform X4 [Bos indicus x Bos taurus]